MIKKRTYSVHYDFHTGMLSRVFFILTILFFIIIGIILILGYTGINNELSQSEIPIIILSFAIIFLFLGILSYFFQLQFKKLSEISEEIEKLQEENIEE